MKEQRIVFIDYFRIIACFLVMLVHASESFYAGGMSYLTTPKVQVADTVGAGDSFTGLSWPASWQGKPVGEAHQIAVDVSAYVCTQSGAMPDVPEAIKHL